MEETPVSEYVTWAVNRALAELDAGYVSDAVMSFFSDMHKHSRTAWICDNPFTLAILTKGAFDGRKEFEKAMRGFAF